MKVNFGRWMVQAAKQYSNKEALVNVERNRRFAFMELHFLTNKICNMMRDRFSMKDGDVYVNLLENDNSSLFSFWMFKGEATGLWLNYRDSFDEHMYQIDYVRPKLIFLETVVLEKYYDALKQRNIEIVCMDEPDRAREGVHYFWELIGKASDAETGVEYDIDDHIVCFRFTGGTTGRGKCAMYALRNFITAVYQDYCSAENLFNETVRHLHTTPITHGTALLILPTFFKGGTNITINMPDLDYFSEVIQKEKVTSTFVVPTLLYRLLDMGMETKYDLSSLANIFYGAAPMSPSKLENLQKVFGNIFVQCYGATEAFPLISVLDKKDHIVENEEDRGRLSAVGRPMAGVEIKIVDDEGIEVATGTTGEIWIRSSSVIKGYYNDPEQTAEGFSQDGFWKSGDMGYMDEKGYFYIVDRKKDMIISGGFNVYAVEVENVLNSHPAVQQSAVIGIPHPDWGEAVHAEVILKENMQAGEEELISLCKERIGKYKAPKSVDFVSELPTSVVGKVLRRKVREKYWQGLTRKVH